MTLPPGELEGAADMAVALRAGRVTSVELLERSLSRLERWQPSINAFSQVWAEDALEAAARVDAMDPDSRPPFAGVPIAAKDLYDVAGRETSGCCAGYRGTIAADDAPTIARMRRAGFVLIGKTNQHEISAGSTNLVSACGRAGNPWDPARMTGGSSGGSAAAIAAGIVPWALGSDTGGSVRIPTAMSGGFALKPTTGRISIEGMLPHSPSLDCPGPMTGNARDLWILYRALADLEPAELAVPEPADLRIGILGGFHREHVADEVLAVVDVVADVFRGAGARVEPLDGAGIEDARKMWSRVAYPELAEAHAPLFEDLDAVAPSIVELLEYGRDLDPRTRAEALDRAAEIARWYRERLVGLDALLVATTLYPAPRADEYRPDPGEGGSVPEDFRGPGWLSCPVNLSRLPALNLPGGRSSEGLPIGVTLIGHDDAEDRLCGLAALWESAASYRATYPEPPPPA